jgi:hypothetical protein
MRCGSCDSGTWVLQPAPTLGVLWTIACENGHPLIPTGATIVIMSA